MIEARVEETIEAPVDRVFEVLGDFRGIRPGKGIDSVDFEGEGVGMTRTIRTPNGVIVERLNEYDESSHRFSYAIVNEDHPLPFDNYSALVTMEAVDEGATRIIWVGSFDVRGVSEEKAVGLAKGIYQGAIQGARETLDNPGV